MQQRIVFVEDDHDLAELIGDYLRSYGLDVTILIEVIPLLKRFWPTHPIW